MSSPCFEPENAATTVQLNRPRSASASDSGSGAGAGADGATTLSSSSSVVGGGSDGVVAAGSHGPTKQDQQQQQQQQRNDLEGKPPLSQRPVVVLSGNEQHSHTHTELQPRSLHTASNVPPHSHSAPNEYQGEGEGLESVEVGGVDDKKHRTHAAAQLPNGPSLLSQALATARGIQAQPSHAQSADSEHTSGNNSGTSNSGGRPGKQPLDTSTSTTHHARAIPQRSSSITADKQRDPPIRHGDNGSTEPRLSQPSLTSTIMAAQTMTSTPVAVPGRDATSVPSSLDPSAFTDVRDMLLQQRNGADRVMPQASTSLDMDRKISAFERTRACSYSTSPEASTTPTNNTKYMDGAATYVVPHPVDDSGRDSRSRNRPAPPDHRYTLGPEKTEKIWSIGSGEGSEEAGLVEKSVAEAMAGVEHNARSRKASYSLRFFKEGLPPDDKTRRRDTKTGGREKLAATAEEDLQPPANTPADPERGAQDHDAATESSTTWPDSKQLPLRASPPSFTEAEVEADYFGLSRDDATKQMTSKPVTPPLGPSIGHEASKQPLTVLQPSQPQVGPTPARLSAAEPKIVEGRRQSGDSTEVGESQEDAEGDESGEEKISSAVFVPHHELSEARAHGRDASSIVGATGQRPRSLSQDEAHPWLVKADEPEPEISDDEEGKTGRLSHYRSRESLVSSRSDFAPDMSDDLAVEGEYEINNQLAQALARSGVQHLEDHVHDHDQNIRQPLEAIELIPYKHQVGGHTTLWRFSRRAVCKQLNNRENEFYETIERYHRDLLSFLPRYVL